MFFSPKKLVIAAGCLLSVVGSASAADYNDAYNNCVPGKGPWGEPSLTGGNNGDVFCNWKTNEGLVVKGIEVWAWSKFGITGFELTFSDDSTSGLVGVQDGDAHNKMSWDPVADKIKTVKVWGNGKGENPGHLYMETVKGQSIDIGMGTNGIKVWEQNVYSGVFLGTYGLSHGGGIIDIGFLFLKSNVKSMQVTNVRMDNGMSLEDLQKASAGIQTYVINEQTFINTNSSTDTEVTWTYDVQVSKHHDVTTEKTSAWSNGGSVTVGVSGGIPEFQASASTTLDWSTSGSSDTATDDSQDQAFHFKQNTKKIAPAGKNLYCRSSAQQGVFDAGYTCDLQLTLEDGSTFSFGTHGKIDQVAYSNSTEECREAPFPSAPTLPTKRALLFSA